MEICLKLGCNVRRKRANGETFHELNEANEAMASKLNFDGHFVHFGPPHLGHGTCLFSDLSVGLISV